MERLIGNLIMKKLLLLVLLIIGCGIFSNKGTCVVDDLGAELNAEGGCIGGNCWCWEDMTEDECAEMNVGYNKMNTYYAKPHDISCADYCVLENVRDACINYPLP